MQRGSAEQAIPAVQNFRLKCTYEKVIKKGFFGNKTATTTEDVGIKMLKIPSGTFNMGSSSGRGDEKPIHEVTLSGFQLSATPVTQGQYEAIMGENPSKFKGEIDSVNRPVEHVSWFDAVRFCNKLSEKQGLKSAYLIGSGAKPTVSRVTGADGFRLPTEAEWEYAARGGQSYTYAGSNTATDVGWSRANSGLRTHEVGGLQANASVGVAAGATMPTTRVSPIATGSPRRTASAA
jgi:formylglycine-generating enzyme required for sulfatase activity